MDKNTINNENNDSTVEIKVLLGDIWRGVIKFGWVALVLVVLFSGIQFYRSYVRFTPMYKVTATFTVHTENKVLSGEDGVKAYSFFYDKESADRLTTVFPHIVGNKLVQRKVCEELGVESMPASVSATGVQGTNMLTLTATGRDPQMTYDALLSIIDNYSIVADYIIGRTKLVMINEPVVPTVPSNTGAWVSSVATAALIGLVLGLGWILIYAILRKTVRTKDDIRNVLNQHCIGMLPQVVFKKYRREINKNIIITNPLVNNEFMESLRLLRSSIIGALDNGEKTVMITSTAPAEGKTAVSINLASIFARDDKRILLVDADLRDSGIKKLFATENFDAEIKEDNQFYRIDYIKTLGFSLLTFKDTVDGIQKIIRNEVLKGKLYDLIKSDEYHYIFIDTPPCGVISDASIVARVVESIVYVIRQDAVYQTSVRTGINAMLETDAKFLGCILNGVTGGIGGYGGNYRYSGYYKYYNYASKYGYYRKSKSSNNVDIIDNKNDFKAERLIEKPISKSSSSNSSKGKNNKKRR